MRIGPERTLWGYEKLGVEPDGSAWPRAWRWHPRSGRCVKQAVDHFRPGDHGQHLRRQIPLRLRACASPWPRNWNAALRCAACGADGCAAAETCSALIWSAAAQQARRGDGGWGLLQGLVLRADGPAAPEVGAQGDRFRLPGCAAGPRGALSCHPLGDSPQPEPGRVTPEQALQRIAAELECQKRRR